MALHTIEPERGTLHGCFSRGMPPVLTIDSGDTVRFRTIDGGWNVGPPHGAPGTQPSFVPRDPERDKGHALCGPVAIRGAEAGMTLQVDIGEMRPAGWGWTRVGGIATPLNERLGVAGERQILHWQINRAARVARNELGFEVAIAPFMGLLGMPPAEPGIHSTTPPRVTGGNIDCKELIVGSSLYLPIAVPGGLFSTGDGHAAQADGEVSGTAIECPMERVDLTFHVRHDLHLTTPRANTPGGWVTFGFHPSLDEAMAIALEAMLDLMGEQYGLSRSDALGMASVAVDLRITQVVNRIPGVHAILPHGVIVRSAREG